jgi:hypothetical protein
MYRWQLKVTILLSPIHTLYSSLQHALRRLSLLFLHWLSLGNTPNAVDPPASVFHGSGPHLLSPAVWRLYWSAIGFLTGPGPPFSDWDCPGLPAPELDFHSTNSAVSVLDSRIKVKVTLQLAVNRPVSLGVKPYLGPKTRFLLLSDSCGLINVGRPLWQEDGSVIYCGPSQTI